PYSGLPRDGLSSLPNVTVLPRRQSCEQLAAESTSVYAVATSWGQERCCREVQISFRHHGDPLRDRSRPGACFSRGRTSSRTIITRRSSVRQGRRRVLQETSRPCCTRRKLLVAQIGERRDKNVRNHQAGLRRRNMGEVSSFRACRVFSGAASFS